jgi:MFS family permease
MARRRDFGLLVVAIGLSALGDWLALVPLALYLEEHSGSGIVLALLFVAIWCPVIVLAGPAGSLADRVDRSRLLFAASIAQAGIAVALAFSTGTAAILVLAALLGAGFAFAQPAEFALIPAVAGEERLAKANGYAETSRYVGFVFGPFVGGVLSAAGGMKIALLVNAATFLVVAVVALVIRGGRAPEARVAGEDLGRARDGIVFLLRDRTLAVVMVVAFVSLLFMTASAPAEVFFAKDVLGVGDVGFGTMMTAWPVGMALGSLFLARRIHALALGALVAIVIQGLGLALPTLWLVFAFAVVGYLIGGLAHGTKNVLIRTLMHERVPQRLHGRAFAAYNGLRNAAELVAILGGGLLIVAIGARWTLFLAGAIPVLAGLIALGWSRRRLAEPDPQSAASWAS